MAESQPGCHVVTGSRRGVFKTIRAGGFPAGVLYAHFADRQCACIEGAGELSLELVYSFFVVTQRCVVDGTLNGKDLLAEFRPV